MQRAATLMLLILAGAAFAAGLSTTEMSTPSAAAQPGQFTEHIDAIYDQQGNLIGGDIDAVSTDSLYWHPYSTSYLYYSPKATSPTATQRTAMSFMNGQGTTCMDPNGNYVYEANSTTLRRFSTVDGSYTDYALSYTGGAGCATDGQYIYRPNGTTMYKYTMTGTYVNSTTTNYSCDAYSISCCRDTVWFTNDRYNGVNLYGYACSKFTGGSISNDVTWNVSTGTNGIGNVCYDGTYFYLPWIGTSPITFKRFYSDRTLYTTGTVNIDSRGCMCKKPQQVSADSLYFKDYGVSFLRVAGKIQSPTPANWTAMSWQNTQSVPCMTPDGQYVYEVNSTTLRRYNTSTGAYDAYALSYSGTGACGTDGQYVYVPNGSTVYKYSMTGTYVNSTTINISPSQYGFAVANDTVWATTAGSGAATYYGYACSRFTGGSISQDATWSMASVGGSTPMNIAWDGTYYYAVSGGYSTNPFMRFYASRSLYTTGTYSGDGRSVMCLRPPRHDVGVSKIVAPPSSLDSGTVVTPACSVYNYGNQTEASYKVRMTIGAYADSATVTSHAPGAALYVTFPSWTASARGSFSVACSTRLTGDADNSNDKKTGTVTVQVRDVGVTHLLAPTGSADSGTTVVPACSVFNWGTAAASCSLRMKIGAGYNRAVYISGQAAGTRAYVTFPSWTATVRGSNAVSCSTELTGDLKTANDKLTGTVTVNVTDVATKIILAPAGTIAAGTVVTPACSVVNYGTTTPASYTVRMKFEAYNQTATVTSHAPGATVYVTFTTWTAVAGTHAVSCSTELATDIVTTNDKLTGSVTVTGSGGSGGWTAKTPMPAGAKQIKDGGWLAYDAGADAGTGRIYASRGNKQPDFFAYNPVMDSWKALAPWLPGTEGKLPGKGSAGCADGNGAIYATKGNNKSGFWKYDATKDSWYQKKDVPLGVSNKKVKGGTDIAWAYKGSTGSPYLLKGYKNEFYRYDTGGDSWQTLSPAPVGANQKWDKGSWLAYDGTSKIYAFKAKYHEFYRYSPDGDSWSAALAPMPVTGSTGSKKAKDGSCGTYLNGGIFALKGGNTQQFFKYTVASNAWAEKETIPAVAPGEKKKKVKAGADIVTVNTVLYATKGNKSNSLWLYVPGAFLFQASEREGVMASPMAIGESQFSIAPNPLASGFAVLRYGLPKAVAAKLSIYNVAGQTVMSQRLVASRSGYVNLDLRHLSNGVYLVKLSSEGFAGSQKLVVQR